MSAAVYIPRGFAGRMPSRRRVSGLGSLGWSACGIAASLTPNFTNDQIAGAYNALAQTFQDEQNELQAMNVWLNQNGQTLTPEGQQAAIAALQMKTQAVNQLQDQVSKCQAIANCLGITGTNVIPALNGLRLGRLGKLAGWPLIVVGVVAAVLTAMGLYAAILYCKSLSEQSKANFQAAQNMKATTDTANQLLSSGQITPDQYNTMLAAGAAAQPCPQGYARDDKGICQPPSPWSQIPWTTLGVVTVVVVGVKALFGD